MRVCEPELNLFEECVHDPVRFEKFQRLATPVQREPKDYFTTVIRKNYFIWETSLFKTSLSLNGIIKLIKMFEKYLEKLIKQKLGAFLDGID